jgi:calpain-7
MLKAEGSEIRDAEMTSAKAAKAEFAKEYDQAFRLYIKAAESFLHLSRSGGTQSDKIKQQWKANASKALERAERIKKFVEKSTASSNLQSPPLRLTPVAINHFSPQEQLYVLKKGTSVNGLNFPLWDDPVPTSPITPYTDPDGQPNLSPDQQKNSCTWKRPNQRPGRSMDAMRRRILPHDILQRIVTDCSVCASISVCLEHSRRFGSTLAASSLSTTQVDGRYDVRVLFNGAYRRIVIDDKLPLNPTNGTLMCMTILPPHPTSKEGNFYDEISWPSLLEKAYMKLMGGYDFPGSNSSIDLHAFIGWIPEYIDIKRSNFERENTWERIQNGFSTGISSSFLFPFTFFFIHVGQCVVTLGTGPGFDNRWRDIQLLPSHSYAVIDVHETEEGRMFTVLNSWVRSNEEEEASSVSFPTLWNTFHEPSQRRCKYPGLSL